ncbi:glycerophosphodiesterase GDE1 [Nannizzia gypsea CBS 118893]|uniref:Glycerophosphodiesterase GDE1 n=1 Tax=Arthroderma gypseum (strain ATCC MYA-4604 / CBS 118893) TaxID=535722 RepID=E4V1Y0_ARTGP|nr:glycerophosphodiesterase GDE1 [Nannizzia gypsea CBS 118893]EFR04045.1 glycerophosphodiesterase GDE1 [Nannizzia gypsea CBS 118893]
MKFEEKLLSFQAPEWKSDYLPYRLLKAMLKRAINKIPPSPCETSLGEFASMLRSALNALRVFLDAQFGAFQGKENMMLEPYRRARFGIESLTSKDIHLIYGELLEDYSRLHLFIRFNYEASKRINSKVEKTKRLLQTALFCEINAIIEEQILCEKQCLKEIERLQTLLATTRQSDGLQSARSLIHLFDGYPGVRSYLTTIDSDILADQAINLGDIFEKLRTTPGISKGLVEEIFNTCLTMSLMCQSWSCTIALIESNPVEVRSLASSTWLGGLLMAIFPPFSLGQSLHGEWDSKINESYERQNLCMELFNPILGHAGASAKHLLMTPDIAGGIPLHYSAQLGLPVICDFILKYLERLGISPKSAILATNTTGITPLQWSVTRGHVQVTRIFLDILYAGRDEAISETLCNLLTIAIECQNDELVQLLASRCSGISHASRNGETCLYVASRIGRRDYVDTLLEVASHKIINIGLDTQKAAYGWTPLTIASAQGHLPIVEALIRAGADELLSDHQGWTAKDHAAFRGHFAVANKLETNKYARPTVQRSFAATPPHNLLDNTTYLIVNLGTVQKGREVKPLDLRHDSKASGQKLLESALTLEISTSKGTAHTLRVPILSDLIDDTMVFPIENPLEARLVFRLLKNTSNSNPGHILIGSGMALLPKSKDSYVSYHKSLIRESTVPILEKETMELLGTVTFTSFTATPFSGLNIRSPSFEYVEKIGSMQLIGHRGSGQNTADRRYLQLGENTIQSFMSAANLGASHVEFDVQLTRDLVPVLYHDLSLSESGTDIAIHDLTLKQFIHASDMQLSSRNDSSDSGSRSRSLSRSRRDADNEARLRMKHTLYFSSNGYKPNTRGDFIQTPLATLEEALLNVPEEVGFDIELKYPRIHEAFAIEMAPMAIELNTFVDTILTLISRFAGSRHIILSSFTPEICILLATKQKAYPIFFITNAGKLPVADREERAGSVQVAVHFANQWGLAGIVFASDVMVMCPQLVSYVKDNGLICATYGPLNNIPESVEVQAKAGVDLLVADRVALVSKALKALG